MSFDADSVTVKKLAAVQEYVAARQWQQAVDQLTEISSQHGGSLVSIAPGRYVNVALQCQIILTSLPAEALAIYRRQVDPQARQWFEAGQRGDEASLRKLLRQAYASSFGDDAIALLAERAWDHGEITAARRLWEQLLPATRVRGEPTAGVGLKYPDSSLPPAEIAARLALCSIVAGEPGRAEQEIAEFTKTYPEAQGTLGGVEGRLADRLRTLLEESKTWDVPRDELAPSTYALTPRRTGVLTEAVDLGGELWSKPLPAPLRTRATDLQPMLWDKGVLPYFPLTFGELALVNSADEIFAWDLATGTPAWGTEDGVIFHLDPRSPDPFPGNRLPAPLGSPRFTMTIHDGRLFAKMGSPLTGRGRHELRDLQSSLVCLDLARQQGRLEWIVRSAELVEGETDWTFEGSPVVERGMAFVVLRKSQPQTQLHVAAFDASNGRMVWNRKIGALVAQNADERSALSHLLLTLGEETLYLSAPAGAVAAIDPQDGGLRWVSTYELPEGDAGDAARIPPIPCLFARGMVVAASPEAGRIFAFDAASGSLRWERKLPGAIRDLLGVTEHGRVIVSGDGLFALDLTTGTVAWNHLGSGADQYGYGRGILAGSLTYWPTRQELLLFDQRTGEIAGRKPLRDVRHITGGNLMIARGCLLIAGADRLTTFCEYGARRKRAERALSRNPQDADAWRSLALASEQSEDWPRAMQEFQRSAELRRQNLSLRAANDIVSPAEDLRRTAKKWAAAAEKSGKSDDVVPALRAAVTFSRSPEDRAKSLMLLATMASRRNRQAVAFDAWSDLLADPDISGTLIAVSSSGGIGSSHRPAAELAHQSRHSLWPKLSQTERDQRMALASEALRTLGGPEDWNECARRLRRYGMARDAPQRALAEMTRLRKSPECAALLAHELLPLPEYFGIKAELQEHWAAAMRDLDAEDLAYPVWSALAAHSPNSRLHSIDGEPTAAKWHTRLQEERKSKAAAEPNLIWERRWIWDVGERRTAIVPEGQPPSDAAALVFVGGDRAEVVGLKSRERRWPWEGEEPPLFVGFAALHLVIADKDAVTACDPVSGAVRWRRATPGMASRASPRRDTPLHAADVRFVLDGTRILRIDLAGAVLAVDGWTGRTEWEFVADGSHIHPEFGYASQHLLLQTSESLRTLGLFTPTGESIDLAPLPFSEALRPPVAMWGRGRGAATLANHRIVSLGIREAPSWVYSEAVSWANADAELLMAGSSLLMVVDGDTLARIDPDHGQKLWSRPLSREPVRRASQLLATDDRQIFSAVDGILRHLRVEDGAVAHELPLEPGTILAVRPLGAQLWVFPQYNPDGAECPVWIVDRVDGTIRQRLRLPARPGTAPIAIHRFRQQVLIARGSNFCLYEATH